MASCSHFSNEAVVGAGVTFRLAAEAVAPKLIAKIAAIATVMMRIVSSLSFCGPRSWRYLPDKLNAI